MSHFIDTRGKEAWQIGPDSWIVCQFDGSVIFYRGEFYINTYTNILGHERFSTNIGDNVEARRL